MAGYIPSEFIDQVLGQTDIVEVINALVPLKKSGANYMACCPFHNEKTPSFSVNPKKQFYYCFGCHEGGSALTFLVKYRNMSFPEAVEELASRAGLRMPATGGKKRTPEMERKYSAGLQALARMTDYFRARLEKAPRAREYLEKRGLDAATVEKYALGYAPDGAYLRECFGERADNKALHDAGLLRTGDTGAYAVFRDRIIFPIRNRKGETIAFGGRALDPEAKAKYLNSPETMFYKKSRTVYGEYELRSERELRTVFVVEGYMDVVSLSRHGLANAAATMGTAVTEGQLRFLLRMSPRTVFCFDGDAAGKRAALKAMGQALACMQDGLELRFMFLPDGHDPDSFVAERGADAFRREADEAAPLSEFLLSHLTRDMGDSIESRAAMAVEAREWIAGIPRETAFRELVLKSLCAASGLSREELAGKASGPARAGRARALKTPKARQRGGALEYPIAWLLRYPKLAGEVGADALRRLTESPDAGEKFLAGMIDVARREKIDNSGTLLACYADTKYHERLCTLYGVEVPPEDEVRRAFPGVIASLADERDRRRLMEEAEKKEPTPDEKRRMQEQLRKGRGLR